MGAGAMVKVAIAHDYLTQRGGAERVVLALASAFPDAPIHTALYDPDHTFPEFRELDVRPSVLNRLAPLRRHHRWAFPILAPVFAGMRVDADVVICSSAGWAHGVRASGKKIVYCHNPARWLYQTEEYLPKRFGAVTALLAPALSLLRRWDRRAALTADGYLANAQNVADRISRAYGIDSQVCHPPGGFKASGSGEVRPAGVRDDFLLTVCRLLAYKNVDKVIQGAARVPGVQLVVVGAGPEAAALTAIAAGTDTIFLRNLDDTELRWLYRHCQAAVSASHEDFGLMPIEAAVSGRPSVVLRQGGFPETVVEGVTGEFFDRAEPDEITHAILRARRRSWNSDEIIEHSGRFSPESFIARVRDVVDEIT